MILGCYHDILQCSINKYHIVVGIDGCLIELKIRVRRFENTKQGFRLKKRQRHLWPCLYRFMLEFNMRC